MQLDLQCVYMYAAVCMRSRIASRMSKEILKRTISFLGKSECFSDRSWSNIYTVEPLITVTSAQRPRHDLRSVKKVPAEF